MSDLGESNSSRPGIVIIAIVALLLVAGIAIWFTTRNPTVERTTTSTTTGSTTVRDVETQDNPASSGAPTTGEQTQDTSPMAPPDSTAGTD